MREKARAKKRSSQAAKVKRTLRVPCNLEGKTSYFRHSPWLLLKKHCPLSEITSQGFSRTGFASYNGDAAVNRKPKKKRTLSLPISLHLLRKTNWSHKKLRTLAHTRGNASVRRTLRENLLNVLITEPLKQDSIITQNKSIIITRGRQESETA